MAYRTPRIELRLEPRVIKSIVEMSGMDHSAIAQKMGVEKMRVDGWVRTGVIEYSKVQAMAKCVSMSENMFLRTVPPEADDLPDYRMAGGAPEKLDAGDVPTIRRARYMQSVAGEMMADLGTAAGPETPPGVTIADSPAEAARGERKRLAPAGDADGPLKGPSRGMYGKLRNAIEDLNILVFQYPIRTGAVRGVSLTGSDPCAILVNSRETDTAKAFTLLHEYGHVLLRSGGVCDEHGTTSADSGKKRTEAWCDRFAASFLMPEPAFAAEEKRLGRLLSDPFEVVDELAKRFKVSRYAAAVRAADLAGGGPGVAYGGVLNKMAGQYSRRPGPEDDGGAGVKKGGPPYLDVLASQMGRKFIRLAVSSHEKGVITSRDLGDYLDIDLKHLDGLCKRARVAG